MKSRDFVTVPTAGVVLVLLLSVGQVTAADLAPGPEATSGASTSQHANYHADYHAPTTAPTALRTVPRARRTTPPSDATSAATCLATGETRPAWIVTGGRGWAGRADTHAGLQGRRLVYVGRVEWGATRAMVVRIRERCTILSGRVCEGAEHGGDIVWIHPDVVAEVTYSELMRGRRDPVLRVIQPAR